MLGGMAGLPMSQKVAFFTAAAGRRLQTDHRGEGCILQKSGASDWSVWRGIKSETRFTTIKSSCWLDWGVVFSITAGLRGKCLTWSYSLHRLSSIRNKPAGISQCSSLDCQNVLWNTVRFHTVAQTPCRSTLFLLKHFNILTMPWGGGQRSLTCLLYFGLWICAGNVKTSSKLQNWERFESVRRDSFCSSRTVNINRDIF